MLQFCHFLIELHRNVVDFHAGLNPRQSRLYLTEDCDEDDTKCELGSAATPTALTGEQLTSESLSGVTFAWADAPWK